ncbi:MAG: 3-hydroxyacyl-ACP dehydratase [Bacteroidota bacterium]
MLLNDFYKIDSLEISTDKCSVQAKVELNGEHEIFKGHFPEIPVVPGVCTVEMIKEILMEVAGKKFMLILGNNIKLHNPINPDFNLFLNIDLTIKYDSDIAHVNSEVYYEKLKFCSFRGDFKIL